MLSKEPLIKSHEGATLAFRDEMREARRSQGLISLANRATKQIARKTASRPGFGAMRRLRRARRSVELGTCDREGERWPVQPQSGEPRPAPLHSFAGATLRGPSSCLSYG